MAAPALIGLVANPRTAVRVGAALTLGMLLALLVLVAVLQGAIDGHTTPGGAGAAPASAEALADIPPTYLALYQQAGAARGVDWAVLAGIGKVECDHGRSQLTGCRRPTANRCGARGPMQMLGNTWRRGTDPVPSGDCPGPASFTADPTGEPIPAGDEARGYATDANDDEVADPWEPSDAVHAAARMLGRNGAPENNETALHAYNPSNDYVANVLDYAERYRARGTTQREFSGTPGNVPLAIVACTAGGTTQVHAQLAPAVEGLYAAAAADGHQLCGGGYRPPGRQIELRRQNCGPSTYAIYEMPSSECSPPTARPGNSNHERGLAIDLTCGGALIRSRSNPCFAWLDDHAADYGLANLPSEPWHWSNDGN
jgi:hypothetical protein